MSGTHIGIIDGLLKRVADTEAERDAAYAERDLHIRAGELMAQQIEKLREYHEEIVHQFAGVSGHLATIIAKAALGDEHMKAIVEEIRKDRAALTTEEPK